jgi:hypothetical protein
MEFLKGRYRDIVRQDNAPPIDRGWRSNSIQPDCGNFFTALLKKNFSTLVGIEYLVVGGSIDATTPYITDGSSTNGFPQRINTYFQSIVHSDFPTLPNQLLPAKTNIVGNYWVCAVQLQPGNINFVPPTAVGAKNPNQLSIDFTFNKTDLPGSWNFREFSLVGTEPFNTVSNKFDLSKLYMINYVAHGLIVKDNNVSFERTIDLTFPPV